MTRPLTAVLAEHREREAVKRARLCLPEAAGEALVFTNRAGDPLDPSWVSHAFHDRLAEAGLPPRRFHDLRHGCAALLLASGADLKVVSSILGHSSIRLTADTYAGVVDRLRGDAAEGLERLRDGGRQAQRVRGVERVIAEAGDGSGESRRRSQGELPGGGEADRTVRGTRCSTAAQREAERPRAQGAGSWRVIAAPPELVAVTVKG